MNVIQVLDYFRKAVSKNRVGHAFIIHGGCEKERKNVVINIAKILECKTSPEICENCYPCKTITTGNFPDVHTVRNAKKSLSIDEVRAIKELMYTKPYFGNHRIFIIETDWIQQPAANSLLKIMEEPPAYGIIIILTRNNKNFLPTIVSRAINLKLNPEPFINLDQELPEEITQLLESASQKNWYDLFKKAEKVSKNFTREEIENFLDWFILLGRQKLLASAGFETLLEKKYSDIIKKIDLSTLTELIDARQYLRFNVNTRIFLELVALKLCVPKWRNWQTR
ncbi:MAG: hypothetical protein NC906_03740 [Candidatus Omnitrophica bacterium]|nr:hypothetical protein [Candidatus Omnitrophota bacterium]MCM8817014.1 hypothetical protein [Candidatus Omnitrophota bacterium]